MSEHQRFYCMNCGHRFVAEVLTAEERRDAQRLNRRLFQLACPLCHRTDVRRGWD